MQPGLLLLSCAVLVALGLPAGAAPDEDLLGKAAGYPVGSRTNWFYDERVRVGSFSHLDSILQHYTLKKAAAPRLLPKISVEREIQQDPPHAGFGLGAARIHDARGRAGDALSLCIQSDRGSDAVAARRDRHLGERISDGAAVAADGRGGRCNLGEDKGRH
jgi:hypothetical protein